MSTADVARDMDLLREALEDRTLNYLGFSYGSMLGQTYANLFPHRVRSVVIDGVLDPVAWTTGRGDEGRTVPFSTRIRSDEGAQRTLGEFFRLCDAAGPECAFSGNARQRYAALAERLRQHPIVEEVPDGPPFRFTYSTLVAATLGALYAPQIWPDLAGLLGLLEDLAAPREITAAMQRIRAGLGVGAARQEQYPNFVEGFPGVGCSDSVNPSSHEAWRRAADSATQRYGYFARLWTLRSSPCAVWPDQAGQDRYLGPWNTRTASPVLVVGNHFDPATRYQGAVTAARLLPNSRLLTYTGWGHTAFLGGNYCVDSTVTRYLVTGQPPAAGAGCRPAGLPFEPTEAPARTGASEQAGGTAPTYLLGDSLLPTAVRQALVGG